MKSAQFADSSMTSMNISKVINVARKPRVCIRCVNNLACSQRVTSLAKAVLDSYLVGRLADLRYSCQYCRVHQSRLVDGNSVSSRVNARDDRGDLAWKT